MQQLLHRGAALTQRRTDEVLDASWDDLKSFLVCTRHKSFRNAAEVLALTSTTLMRRIDRLEERIGCKLFLRDQSGLTLSEEGAAMIADVTDSSKVDRFPENLPEDHGRSSLRDGACRRRATGV
jgi:DNA-binding Lrp family transcriptional regulator